MGHIRLHEMQKKVCGPRTEVIAFNTDSIKVINPRKSFVPVPKDEAKPGDICLEEKVNLRGNLIRDLPLRPVYQHGGLPWKEQTVADVNDTRGSVLGEGQPGCGKSYLLKALHKADTDAKLKSAKLCWTKTAALNIDGQTLDHFFASTSAKDWIKKGTSYNALSFDEDTIIPERWWSLFFQMKQRNPSLKFRFFGGPNQLHSEDYDLGSKLWFNYHNSAVMHYLVDGNRVLLQYLEATARYDRDLKNKLDVFESTQSLQIFGETSLFTPKSCDFNIVRTWQRRDAVNQEWVKALSSRKEITKCGALSLWKGMYLISHKNEGLIVNSTRYRLLNMTETMVGLQNELSGEKIAVSYDTIAKTCKYGYADTVMRVISRTIPGNFNIHECDSMDWNQMFVALWRARTASAIGMVYPADRKFPFASPPAKGGLIAPQKDLFTGKLYQRTDGHNIYIGSTNNIENRKKGHAAKAVSKKVVEWEQQCSLEKKEIVMTELESYICSDVDQLVKREYELIARVPSDVCMNTRGTKKAAVAATTTTMEPVEVSYTRFNIIDDEKNSRWRIQWRHENVASSKVFSYKTRSKESERLLAEEFRASLVKKYFI